MRKLALIAWFFGLSIIGLCLVTWYVWATSAEPLSGDELGYRSGTLGTWVWAFVFFLVRFGALDGWLPLPRKRERPRSDQGDQS